MRLHLLLLSLLSLVLLSGCGGGGDEQAAAPKPEQPPVQSLATESVTLRMNGDRTMNLNVEIADEPPEWAVGLMNRSELSKGSGMLFVFPNDAERSFWMKNTPLDLDILFFTNTGDLVSAESMIPCKDGRCPYVTSKGPARYALEVRGGFLEENGPATGWKLLRGGAK